MQQPARLRVVVADAGPLNYLILIGEIEILPGLVGQVLVPFEVRDELDRPRTPAPVREWIASPPSWVRMVPTPPDAMDQSALAKLGIGERAAIVLADANGVNAVLMDDRAGVAVARARGLEAVGTLGLLQLGARRGLLDLPDALARLTATNFHIRRELLDRLLTEAGHKVRARWREDGT
jgi:predicted nucleic acid-binding protein